MRKIQTIVEFGCGDGNQLTLAVYPFYTGYDVSAEAVRICQQRFSKDSSKRFRLLEEYDGEQADLSLSLDVIYHLIEDHVYEDYMRLLFDAAKQYVVIYSSNSDEKFTDSQPHVRHRVFTDWIETNRPDWKILEMVPNIYPYDGDNIRTTFSDFYFYKKASST